MTPGNDILPTSPFRRLGVASILLALLLAPPVVAQAPSSADLPVYTSDLAGDITRHPDVGGGSELHLVANVPASRLDAFVDGRRVKSYRVTVGAPWNKTPLGEREISRVIWNPWWHPPANRRPKEKTASPGPNNPMGRVKMQFGPLYYVHGTAKTAELGRAASRGCIRMDNAEAIELARLVHHFAGPELSEAELALLVEQPRKTRRIELPEPVRLSIVYRTAEIRDDALHVYEDVYRRGAPAAQDAAVAALGEAGLAIEDVDPTTLETVQAATLPVTIPLSALLRPQPPTVEVAAFPAPFAGGGSEPQREVP